MSDLFTNLHRQRRYNWLPLFPRPNEDEFRIVPEIPLYPGVQLTRGLDLVFLGSRFALLVCNLHDVDHGPPRRLRSPAIVGQSNTGMSGQSFSHAAGRVLRSCLSTRTKFCADWASYSLVAVSP